MKAADTALYTSKDSGKNKFSVFDQEMNRHQLRRMSLEKDLRKALARSEFMVVYQPKWDSFMNVTVGLEALLRWRHPEHGIVSPAEFIPIAEETGLIVPITYWMLHDVCGQNMLWHRAEVANVPVSINMSARMFEGGGLYDVVEEALTRSGLEPHFLELEITESIAMNNMEETVAQLSSCGISGCVYRSMISVQGSLHSVIWMRFRSIRLRLIRSLSAKVKCIRKSDYQQYYCDCQ